MLRGTKIINNLELLLKHPVPEVVDEVSWHDSAPDRLLPTDPAAPKHLFESGMAILSDFPYHNLQVELHGLVTGDTFLKTVSQSRKILIIGRDALILTARDYLPPNADPLFGLVRKLGRIADTKARKPGLIEKALAHTAELAENPLELTPELIGLPILQSRLLAGLTSSDLISRTNSAEESAFHDARKNFRQVLHAGMVVCDARQSPDFSAFLAAGRRLSELYGDHHDSLLQQSKS